MLVSNLLKQSVNFRFANYSKHVTYSQHPRIYSSPPGHSGSWHWCPPLPKISPHMASVEHKLANFKHTTLNDVHTDFTPEVRTTLISPSQHLVPSQLNTCRREGKTPLHQTSDEPRI